MYKPTNQPSWDSSSEPSSSASSMHSPSHEKNDFSVEQQLSPVPSYMQYQYEQQRQHPQQHYQHQQHQQQRHQQQPPSYYGNEIVHSPISQKRQQFAANDEYQYLNSPSSVMASTVDPPSWSVPARGDSHLEPIGDTAYAHSSIDLTTRPFFSIGRSPLSDIPLLHITSSRRHALLFHHPSGACYITDCFSAHGTYLDGVRVQPYPHPPRRVRRGSMLRFGGEGSPTFIMKCFSVRFTDMVRDLGGVADSYLQQPSLAEDDNSQDIVRESSSTEENLVTPQRKAQYFRHARQWVQHSRHRKSITSTNSKDESTLACIRGDGGGVACIADGCDAPTAALVLLNTRLNALGGPDGLRCSRRARLAMRARDRFSSTNPWIAAPPLRSKKRGRKEFECGVDGANNMQQSKRIKSILVTDRPSKTPLDCSNVNCIGTIVSPNQPVRQHRRRISFSDEISQFLSLPSISPDNSSDEISDEENDKGIGMNDLSFLKPRKGNHLNEDVNMFLVSP